MPAASSREDTPGGFQQTPPRSYQASPSMLSHSPHPSPPTRGQLYYQMLLLTNKRHWGIPWLLSLNNHKYTSTRKFRKRIKTSLLLPTGFTASELNHRSLFLTQQNFH